MSQQRLRDLKGLGEKSEAMLCAIGIETVEQLMEANPYQLYAHLKEQFDTSSLNILYAIIGAQEDIHWQEAAQRYKSEILMCLDDMGLAPK